MTDPRSIAAFEGFYGPPYPHAERCALVAALPSMGVDAYWYGPKDDPFQRARWRDPYPAARMTEFEELAEVARTAGVDLAATVSPGLDLDEDPAPLVAKLRGFHALGVRRFGIAFDDTPDGGAPLGDTHGRFIAAVAAGLPSDARLFCVPVDYATDRVTPYLRALVDASPAGTPIGWTGPAIVSPTVRAELAQRLQADLGAPLAFGDNYPVSDGGMAGMLHLGPAPERDPAVHDVVAMTAFNLTPRPRSSAFGLAVAARAVHEPSESREAGWEAILGARPAWRTLARACRAWLTAPGPDASLVALIEPALDGDDALLEFLARDPLAGLDEPTRREVEPWAIAFRWEAFAMALAIHAVRGSSSRAEAAMLTSEAWRRVQVIPEQVFGIRRAVYPVTRATDAGMRLDPDASIIRGENLTDLVCRAALERLR